MKTTAAQKILPDVTRITDIDFPPLMKSHPGNVRESAIGARVPKQLTGWSVD